MLGAETDTIDLAKQPSIRRLGEDYEGPRVPGGS